MLRMSWTLMRCSNSLMPGILVTPDRRKSGSGPKVGAQALWQADASSTMASKSAPTNPAPDLPRLGALDDPRAARVTRAVRRHSAPAALELAWCRNTMARSYHLIAGSRGG